MAKQESEEPQVIGTETDPCLDAAGPAEETAFVAETEPEAALVSAEEADADLDVEEAEADDDVPAPAPAAARARSAPHPPRRRVQGAKGKPKKREAASASPARERELVPGWLALLVLVLIIAVVGVAGFVLRGAMSGGEKSPERADIEKWTKAVQADPDDLDARLNLAYAYQQDQQYDAALKGYEAVLTARPADMAALYNTGVIYMLTGKAKQGEAALWDVLEIDSTHALAAKELGEYYAAKRQYKSLLVAVGPALEAKPSLADLQYLAGLAYENLGDKDRAEGHYRQALQYSPEMQRAKDGLGRLGVGAQ